MENCKMQARTEGIVPLKRFFASRDRSSKIPLPRRQSGASTLLQTLALSALATVLGGTLLRGSIPAGILGETKLSDVPGQGFGSSMLAIQGDTLVAKTNVYVRRGPQWAVDSTFAVSDPVTPHPNLTTVAISEDQNTLVAGAPAGNGGTGAVYVLVRGGSGWTQSAELLPTEAGNGDMVGVAVAIQGEWILVGAPSGTLLSNQSTGQGHVYLFHNVNGVWIEAKQLVPDDGATGDYFGETLAISGDRIVVGAAGNSNDVGTQAGAVYVFERNAGGTDQWGQTAKLVPPNSDSHAFYQHGGKALDLAGDVIAVGSEAAAFVYRYSSDNTWQLEGDTLRPAEDNYAMQVSSIKLNPDGDSFVASDYQPQGQTGAAFLFSDFDSTWSEAKMLQAGDAGPGRFFGWTTDLSGETIAINDALGSVYVYAPDYTQDAKVTSFVRQSLYYEDADNTSEFPKDQAAFRYKALLYAVDETDPAKRVHAQLDKIDSLYGDAERARAQAAEDRIRQALRVLPDDTAYQELFLDIYYDRTVAESLFAKEALSEAEKARFGPPLASPAPDNGFIIENEIPRYQQCLASNAVAMQGYFDLLKMSLQEQPPSSSGTDTNFGYHLFQTLVPTRGLMPATYLDTNGLPQSVTANNAALFSGYKDLVLLFELLRDRGSAATALGRLLMARDGTGDLAEASNVVSRAEQSLFLEGTLLKGMFVDLPDSNDPSALAQAIGGWSASLAALTTLQQDLSGHANLLGFGDDFMMFVQQFAGQSAVFDSYDALKARLDPASGSNPLHDAVQALDDARSAYSAYRGFQDQLAAQFTSSTTTYENRLFQIVGLFPGQPGYDNPYGSRGSELDQQYSSIQQARLKILKNDTEIKNLYSRVEIEIQKAADISDAIIRFGDQQEAITEELAKVNAAQEGANQYAEYFSPENLVTGASVAIAINAPIQIGAELQKGDLEAQKERLAALQQATIVGIQSDAAVKTMLLDMNTLLIDSQESAALLRQELDRLTGLYREKRELETKLAERDANLAQRFFADPVHRLAALSDMVSANLSFDEAQKWLFFMERALEYKWNAPFSHTYNGKLWTRETLFKLRNADELAEMYAAMDDYDSQRQPPQDDYYDWFSVRDDFFGYKLTNSLGQALVYPDPVTGQPEGALEAFRSRLRQSLDAQGNINIRFSTLREIPGGSFFLGPRFDANGNPLPNQHGTYLDKIKYMQITLPGHHTLGRSQLTGYLTYGGTSFIRQEHVGTFQPDRPDRLQNELTAYSTRFWYFDSGSDSWQSTEALSAPVTMELSSDPRIPPSTQQIDVFNERSVAASDWQLTIPTVDLGVPVLSIDELDDVELYFYHVARIRP
jgi:FG-GAP repeat